jgi:hypothetical protein
MIELETTTFDVIRRRLEHQVAGLASAVGNLEQERKRLFGSIAIELIGTHRVRTENASVPRDLVVIETPAGPRFILGCEVVIGLRSKVVPGDIFSELAETTEGIGNGASTLLVEDGFLRDFSELFQYYKDARLLHLRRTGELMLVVFQTGLRLTDTRVLRFDVVREGLRYRDARGERDYVFPPAQDFAWTRSTRELHVLGPHPHINISDTIFVECIGGDLTVKIENNTATGLGIYCEPVDNAIQGLDDAEIYFAELESCILLKIRPYQERTFRYLVYNRRTQEVVRIDEIGLSCQQLPEGQGLIFPGGGWLADGRVKRFPVDAAGMEFKRAVRAPNGEDVCYVFYRRDVGTYLLLMYNLITRELASPIACHSWCNLADGRVVVLRAESEPTRIHVLQVWKTPFCSDEHQLSLLPSEDSFLARLGNRELVRAVSDLLHLQRLAGSPVPTRPIYDGMQAHVARLHDAYPWLATLPELATGLAELRTTIAQVIDEFAKISEFTQAAAGQVAEAKTRVEALLFDLERGTKSDLASSRLEDKVEPLARLRAMRGQLAGLAEIRFVDAAAIAALDERVAMALRTASARAVEFLLSDVALQATSTEITRIEAEGAAATSVATAGPLRQRLDDLAAGIDVLVETVGSLDIADQTQRTAILERITGIYAGVGRARAVVANRRTSLGQAEGRSAFAVHMQLLAQATANSLGLASDPQRCDELAGKLLIQVEELEGKFGEFPEFIAELGSRRAEISEAFAAQKQQLLDARARHADGLVQALERILATISRRCQGVATREELQAYLAADPLVAKARALIANLSQLGSTVAAGDAEGRLSAARDAGLRRLRDRTELFDEDGAVRLGRHRFSLNATPLELTLLPRRNAEGVPGLVFHLTGTEYERPVPANELAGTQAFWEWPSEAETASVAKAEYLAWNVVEQLAQVPAAGVDEAAIVRVIHDFTVAHSDHGYERGIHDADALKLVRAMIHLRAAGGLLATPATDRALAQRAWAERVGHAEKAEEALATRCRALAEVHRRLGKEPLPELLAVRERCTALAGTAAAGAYLHAELARGNQPVFVRSAAAATLCERFQAWCHDQLTAAPIADEQVLTAWVRTYAERHAPELSEAVPEVVVELLHPHLGRETVSVATTVVVEGLLSTHARIHEGRCELRLTEMVARLTDHQTVHVPAYRAYQAARARVVAAERQRLRLQDFKPQVLASFVRNRLIDEVLLPLIGDNFAKQIGALGAGRRTDQQGLLLLISPPGYGKTTLMEYVASVLGLVLVKVNGPALGHLVTSLDPAAAPDVAARQEVERINLAFAMGTNVLLYLDDIQHTSSELLQRFISLCDGTRRVEGVRDGQPTTFDLRGKRFVVCMAGNPYTESGARFRIPDMLANRADTCNLGDIVGGAAEAFAYSYIENALVAHPALKPLAARSPADVQRLLRLASGEESVLSELEHPYTASEISELGQLFAHLVRIQQHLLMVNQAYIASAAQADADRSEPLFKLQGSYRNMGKLTARVAATMTTAEVEALILDHYRQESQTLTQGAEANLLKLKELFGWLADPAERARWTEICRGFARRTELAGADDPLAHAVLQLSKLVQGVTAIAETLGRPALVPEIPKPPEVKLEVINTLPSHYAKLYEHHLQVLETSLIPVLELLTKYTGGQAKARAELASVAGEMREVLAKHRDLQRIKLERRPEG